MQKIKELLNLIREETPRRILIYLLFSYVCSQIELSKELEMHSSTVAFHLKKLQNKGIILQVPARNGLIYMKSGTVIIRKPLKNEIFYQGTGNGDAIIKLLITHRNGFDDRRVIDYFKYCEKEGGTEFPKKIPNFNSAVDNIIETIHEILPHPYYV